MGKLFFGTEDAGEAINRLEAFLASINSPVKLWEAGLDDFKKDEIVKQMNLNKVMGMHYDHSESDRAELVELMI